MATTNKVAIVGFWEVTRDLAPFDDPSFRIWGLNHLWPHIPRWDVWYDFHSPEWSSKHLKPEVWKEQEEFFRTNHERPLYMCQAYDWIPSSIEFPLDRVMAAVGGRRYFTSGIAYMLAHAIAEGATEIHVYGADMRHEEEYAIQRPCVEYLLGVAEGRGIKVYIPEQSALLSHDVLYGYEGEEGAWVEMRRALVEERARCQMEHSKALAAAQTYDGAAQLADDMLRRVDQRRRGGIL